jgi:hypothetical protein
VLLGRNFGAITTHGRLNSPEIADKQEAGPALCCAQDQEGLIEKFAPLIAAVEASNDLDVF